MHLVNARGIVTLWGSTSESCDRSGNGSCAQNPWKPVSTHSNWLQELKSICSAFHSLFRDLLILSIKIETFKYCSFFEECLERWCMSENNLFMLEKMHKVPFLVYFDCFWVFVVLRVTLEVYLALTCTRECRYMTPGRSDKESCPKYPWVTPAIH